MSLMEVITKISHPSNCHHFLPPLKFLRPKGSSQSLKKMIIVKASKEPSGEPWRRDYGGRLVDERMIILRMHLRRMKMLETSHRDELPSHWMDWERKYYGGRYREDICAAVGLLQKFLMSVKPGLAIGLVALVALSVPLSTGVALFGAGEIAKETLIFTYWLIMN